MRFVPGTVYQAMMAWCEEHQATQLGWTQKAGVLVKKLEKASGAGIPFLSFVFRCFLNLASGSAEAGGCRQIVTGVCFVGPGG